MIPRSSFSGLAIGVLSRSYYGRAYPTRPKEIAGGLSPLLRAPRPSDSNPHSKSSPHELCNSDRTLRISGLFSSNIGAQSTASERRLGKNRTDYCIIGDCLYTCKGGNRPANPSQTPPFLFF